MTEYPPGAWELDLTPEIMQWLRALSRMPSKVFREMLMALSELAIRLDVLSQPLLPNDDAEESDSGAVDPPPHRLRATKSPAPTAPPARTIVVNSVKVSNLPRTSFRDVIAFRQCDLCNRGNRDCLRYSDEAPDSRCKGCHERKKGCSLTQPRRAASASRPRRGKEKAEPVAAPEESEEESDDPGDRGRERSPGLFSSIKKTLSRKSQGATSTSPVATKKSEPRKPVQRKMEVAPPPMPRPMADYHQYRASQESDFLEVNSPTPPFQSTSSLHSYSTSSLDPAVEFELETLRRKFRESQEDLQRERQRAATQESEYRREMELREARHQRELEYVRAQRGEGNEQTERSKRRM